MAKRLIELQRQQSCALQLTFTSAAIDFGLKDRLAARVDDSERIAFPEIIDRCCARRVQEVSWSGHLTAAFNDGRAQDFATTNFALPSAREAIRESAADVEPEFPIQELPSWPYSPDRINAK
jgi:hypothetical protein